MNSAKFGLRETDVKTNETLPETDVVALVGVSGVEW